ncbi:MAG: ComF family protein [Actinomycetota bacterium]
MKLRAVRPYAGPLADLCVKEIHRAGALAEVVTWVPGRRRETRRRGFDHAEEIARRVAIQIGLPARALLERRGDTTDQTKLGRAERSTNLQGAFESRPVSVPVLLVDDLYTTGATAAVCGREILRAGAPNVEAVVACRA